MLKARFGAQKVHVEHRVIFIHHVAHEILGYDEELCERGEFLSWNLRREALSVRHLMVL